MILNQKHLRRILVFLIIHKKAFPLRFLLRRPYPIQGFFREAVEEVFHPSSVFVVQFESNISLLTPQMSKILFDDLRSILIIKTI